MVSYAFIRGPEGLYKICFGNSKVTCSSPTWVFFSSNVYKMVMLNKAEMLAKMPLFSGQVWEVQPQIKLSYSDGSPVVGKRVAIFSWPEPEYNPDKGTNAFTDAIKFAFFENSLSLPSNNDGVAIFKNLTVQ